MNAMNTLSFRHIAKWHNQNPQSRLGQRVSESLAILAAAFKRWDSREILISFNGGKDATVLLHLVRYCASELNVPMPSCVYWEEADAFPDVNMFVDACEKFYDLDVIRYRGTIVQGLTELVEKRNSQAFILGTRASDPNGAHAAPFEPSSPGWGPNFTRVNPLLQWEYQDIWNFLIDTFEPYCKLYDVGYTSLGNLRDTLPNPALRNEDGTYKPAFMLKNGELERNGRL